MARRGMRFDESTWLDLIRAGSTNEEVAGQFGCTVRTLDRHRRAHPEFNDAILALRAELSAAVTPPEHGTAARYRRGCRCTACKAANTAYHYAYSQARRERLGMPPADPNHGRRRGVAQTVAQGRISNPSPRTLIEQAIARGASTSWIMNAHGVDYATVQDIRQSLDAAVA